MNRATSDRLEALRLRLEMTFYGADDKYTGDPYAGSPVAKPPPGAGVHRHVLELARGLPEIPTFMGIVASVFREKLEIVESQLKHIKDVSRRKELPADIRKSLDEVERAYKTILDIESALKVLDRGAGPLKKDIEALEKSAWYGWDK